MLTKLYIIWAMQPGLFKLALQFSSDWINAMPKACACHILVKTAAEAEKLKQLLAKGASFHDLAKKHSLCPSGKKGGDLGEFKPGQMVRAFDEVVFKKAVLEVHGPIKTQFGYHLIKTLYRS